MASRVTYGRCMNPGCSFIAQYGVGCQHGKVNTAASIDCVYCGCNIGIHNVVGYEDNGSAAGASAAPASVDEVHEAIRFISGSAEGVLRAT